MNKLQRTRVKTQFYRQIKTESSICKTEIPDTSDKGDYSGPRRCRLDFISIIREDILVGSIGAFIFST